MERYYTHFAVAVARGNLIRQGKQQLLPAQLLHLPLSQLTAVASAIIAFATIPTNRRAMSGNSRRCPPKWRKASSFQKDK